MLTFHSASTRVFNSAGAIKDCMDTAFGEGQDTDCDLLIIYSAMGHDFGRLLQQAKQMAPSAKVVGGSCAGIVGREGVSESMKDVAVMAVRGEPGEIAVAHTQGVTGLNSRQQGEELAQQLAQQSPNINMVFFLATGIDIANDEFIAGIESVLGEDVEIFGATTADKMKCEINFQFIDQSIHQDAAIAVGFADPSLEVIGRATHGFVAIGDPMTVTRSEGNRIYELDGQPAWEVYTQRLGIQSSASPGDTIAMGALAEELPEDLRQEYGSDHILRVITKRSDDGVMYYATDCPKGTRLWLTTRDEERIFSELNSMVNGISEQANNQKPVAVFHADCVARGRFMFSRFMKDELVYSMQHPFSVDGEVPPWLGIYGFGEFARLGGANTFHNYTSTVTALYRR